jgi:hypothetical protein
MMDMSYEDLPKGRARELRLSDHTHAADVIDLITLEADRDTGCFSAMLCDDQDRGVQPVCVKELSSDAPVEDLAVFLQMVLPLLAKSGGSILMAIGRRGPTRANDEDRECHQRAIELCQSHGVRLLGFHVATSQGVCRLPDPLEQVA